MKTVLAMIVTCMICISGYGQKEFTKSLEGIERVEIESQTDVVVKGHNSKQLLLKGETMKAAPEKAKGLTLVGEGGTDNTNVGFFIEQKGNILVVKNLNREGKAVVFLPSSQNFSVRSPYLNDIEIEGFTGEVEASAELVGSISIKDVTGPLTVSSNTGNVEIVFSNLNQNSPTTVTTTTGTVDITLPRKTAATVTMNSVLGEIYTDFDLQLPEKNGLKAVSTQKLKGTLNGGGGSIQLNSATGNIFLRKK